MTDRELLELAAKAAGMTIGYEASQCFYSEHGTYGAGMYCLNERGDISSRWNPLTDDGDALRLAVKLNIQVTPGTYNPEEFSAFKAAGGEAHEFRHFQQDEFAATRRAITRAAAAIGARDE